MTKVSLKPLVALVLAVLLLTGVVVTGGCVSGKVETPTPETPTQIIENVTPQEAFALILNNQNDPDFAIIDVRTSEEFAEGHIENAININFRSENFRGEIDRLDRDKTYLLHCRSGSRSSSALNVMKELNFIKIYHMTGGIIEWTEEGLPTVK